MSVVSGHPRGCGGEVYSLCSELMSDGVLRLDVEVSLLLEVGNAFDGDGVFGGYEARDEFFKGCSEEFH